MTSRVASLSAITVVALGGCASDYVGMCGRANDESPWPTKVMAAAYTSDSPKPGFARVAAASQSPAPIEPTPLSASPIPTQPQIAPAILPPIEPKPPSVSPIPTQPQISPATPPPIVIPPSPEVLAACGKSKQCQARLATLLADPLRAWIKTGATPEDYQTGFRILAFRVLRPSLNCEEIAQAIREAEVTLAGSAGPVEPGISDNKPLLGVQLLARAVRNELEAEQKQRCKRSASADQARSDVATSEQAQFLLDLPDQCADPLALSWLVKNTPKNCAPRASENCNLAAGNTSSVGIERARRSPSPCSKTMSVAATSSLQMSRSNLNDFASPSLGLRTQFPTGETKTRP